MVAEATLLESETTTLGNLRTSQTVRDLPLNGRNFAALLALTTGVVPAQSQVQSVIQQPNGSAGLKLLNGSTTSLSSVAQIL